MENLTILCHEFRTFPEIDTLDFSDIVSLFCWEPNLEYLYLSNKGSVYELNVENKAVSPIFSLNNALKNTSSSYIVGLAYLTSLESLCVAVSSGELFTVERHFARGYKKQLVASAGSIKLMEWSPSHDTVAVLTNEQQLLVMSADFDLVAELDIQTIKASEEFVSVGWGKEETQFKGSVGKKAQSDSTVEDLKLVDVLGSDPLISWRGDGQLFSVNFVKLENQSRCVSVFNRDGELLYSNCNIPGIENSLAWRPSGNFIAVTQRLPNKHQVCLIEKNTLKHSAFDMPFAVNEVRVKQLCWSADSKVLLLWCMPQLQENAPAQFLNSCCESFLLFSSYNYHWYLKQRFDFTEQNRPLTAIWDIMSDCRLHVFSVGGRYDCYDFDWTVSNSQGATKDGAYVALIDNARVNLTSFRVSVIPPPMCTVSVPFSSTPRQVMFPPAGVEEHWVRFAQSRGPPARGCESFGENPNDICVILTDGSIVTLTYQTVDKFDVAVHKFKWKCKEERRIQDLHHWVWIAPDTLFCCGSVEGRSQLYLVKIEDNEEQRFVFVSSCTANSPLVTIASMGDGRAVIQTKDGLLSFVDGTVIEPHNRLPDVYRYLAVRDGRIFGLTKRFRLYIDGDLAGDNVTSLSFHSKFFLITTSRNRLLACYFIDSPLKGMITEGDNSSGIVAYGRRVERGSKLLHAISEDVRVILSLPRGNLECIQPRALTMDFLVRSLEKYQYRESFELARKQRIDLNILFDQDPTAFFRNADAFVKEVEPEWICLFLSELKDEDVTTTMYEPYFTQPRPMVVENKVCRVCSAVREAIFRQHEEKKFRLALLSSWVHTRTQIGLEEALRSLKELKKLNQGSASDVTWSDALKHLLYLTRVDQLLETALGMYDFDLVLLVASKSDKDPQEYLAFLNELNKMDPTYQKFRIDKHLRRWTTALSHLIESGTDYEDELIEFVKEHNFYKEALAQLTIDDDRYEELMKAYAEYLGSKRLFDEAGTVSRQLGDHRAALFYHTKALVWKECLIDICNIFGSVEEKRQELIQLATALSGAKQHITAGRIYECYLEDPESALSCYINGHDWQEAIALLYTWRQTFLLGTVIPKVEEHGEYLLSQVTCLEKTFLEREARLHVVRSQKLDKWNTARSAGDAAMQEDGDLFSDSSSVSGSSVSSTGSTASTGSTGSGRSKNRRKRERKIFSLKEDNPYEEGALVYALHNTITSAFQLRADVSETCRALIHFEKFDYARSLQGALASLLTQMESKLSVIWPPRHSLNPETGPNPYDEMASLEPIYQFAPTIPICAWESALLKKDETK